MKYDGTLIIKYGKGVSSIQNVPGLTEYRAGEIMCQLSQGETLYNLTRKVRVIPANFPENLGPITQEAVDRAEYAIKNFLLDYADEEPLAVYVAVSVFYKILEKHRTLISRSRDDLLKYAADRIMDIASDQRADYVCGQDMSSFGYVKRVAMVEKFINLENLGGYLMLCYAEYVADILDGLSFFHAAAAVETDTATESDKELTSTFLRELESSENIHGAEAMIQYDAETGQYDMAYRFTSLLALDAFEYIHMKEAGAKIMKCQNPECGKFFIALRNTAKFCGYSSPQDPEKICKVMYPQILLKKKKDSDEAYRYYRKVQSKLMKRRQHHPESYDKYQGDVERLSERYLALRRDLDTETISLPSLKEELDKF